VWLGQMIGLLLGAPSLPLAEKYKMGALCYYFHIELFPWSWATVIMHMSTLLQITVVMSLCTSLIKSCIVTY
jgi:hypothetical protein